MEIPKYLYAWIQSHLIKFAADATPISQVLNITYVATNWTRGAKNVVRKLLMLVTKEWY